LPSARSRALGKELVYSNCESFLSHSLLTRRRCPPHRRVAAAAPSPATPLPSTAAVTSPAAAPLHLARRRAPALTCRALAGTRTPRHRLRPCPPAAPSLARRALACRTLAHRAQCHHALTRRAPRPSPRLDRRCPHAIGALDRRALACDPPSRPRPNLQGELLASVL
jgi:hypothetical protein